MLGGAGGHILDDLGLPGAARPVFPAGAGDLADGGSFGDKFTG